MVCVFSDYSRCCWLVIQSPIPIYGQRKVRIEREYSRLCAAAYHLLAIPVQGLIASGTL